MGEERGKEGGGQRSKGERGKRKESVTVRGKGKRRGGHYQEGRREEKKGYRKS